MVNFPEAFNVLLNDSDLPTQRAMLVALHNSIVAKEKAVRQQTPILPADDPSKLVEFVPDFVSPSEDSDDLLLGLGSDIKKLGLENAKSRPNKVTNQWITTDGISAYTFGGIKHNPKSLSNFPSIRRLLDKVNADSRVRGNMDSCLVTCYRSNTVTLGRHTDDEVTDIDQTSSICSFSIGSSRDIEFYVKGSSASAFSHNLTEGSLLIMKPRCQQFLEHRVPRGSGINDGSRSVRYSISFRKLAHNAAIEGSQVAQ